MLKLTFLSSWKIERSSSFNSVCGSIAPNQWPRDLPSHCQALSESMKNNIGDGFERDARCFSGLLQDFEAGSSRTGMMAPPHQSRVTLQIKSNACVVELQEAVLSLMRHPHMLRILIPKRYHLLEHPTIPTSILAGWLALANLKVSHSQLLSEMVETKES